MNYREIINQIIDATEEHVADGDKDITVCMSPGTIVELWSLANMDGGYWATMNQAQPGIAYMLLGYPLVAVVGIPPGEFVISSVTSRSRERMEALAQVRAELDRDRERYLTERLGTKTVNEMRAMLEELERKR